MASSGNPNQQPQPIPTFDMQSFFKPTNPSPSQPPNPPNLNISPPFLPPSGPYSYPPQSAPFQPSPYHHYPYHPQPQNVPLHHQRSLSYPTPPLQPPISSPTNPNPNSGARLMALLNPNQPLPPAPPNPPSSSSSPAIMNLMLPPPPIRMPSSKLPKARHLGGDRVVYDVDMRLEGETQPQLEVTLITKYQSDPHLVFGRQIAHNKI